MKHSTTIVKRRAEEDNFAYLEKQRNEFISKLHAKHPKQSRYAAEDAFHEALAFFCDPINRHLLRNCNTTGLVIQRANWLMTNEWRREKKHEPLNENRERASLEFVLIDRKMDIETFLATLPQHKRDVFRCWLQGHTYEEIAQKYNLNNNSALRKRISRLYADLASLLNKR